jgi:hypothetical protein
MVAALPEPTTSVSEVDTFHPPDQIYQSHPSNNNYQARLVIDINQLQY